MSEGTRGRVRRERTIDGSFRDTSASVREFDLDLSTEEVALVVLGDGFGSG
jgi:hypothetical protein